MKKIDCPMCHGEGYLEDLRPGGYFNQRSEQWYPLEEAKECPLCNGTREIEAPAHPNTFNVTSHYQQLKERREAKRSTTNQVVLSFLGKAA
jgi:RecJ-like exonuclease